MKKTDIAIIGAGVVGCAIARELALQNRGKKITVLEKLSGAGLETSSKNSGVLHSGFHQNPSFLKSMLARIGSVMAARYCEDRNLPILHTGMIIAVSRAALQEGLWRETGAFLKLIERGRKQKIKFEFLLPPQLKKIEPNLKALFGIFIHDVWVVDSLRFTETLKRNAEERGVRFLFDAPVSKIEKRTDSYIITFPNGEIETQAVVNAAGLYADDIARLAGFNQYKIYPWRGEYYEVVGMPSDLVRRLIYPAVPHNYPGKGIHFSPRVDGRLFIGPNARPVPSKNFYEEDKTPVGEFLNAAERFIPQIKEENLRWAYSGIRPKITNDPEETDFIIKLDSAKPAFVNLIGIESPGLASAMAIGKYINEITKDAF